METDAEDHEDRYWRTRDEKTGTTEPAIDRRSAAEQEAARHAEKAAARKAKVTKEAAARNAKEDAERTAKAKKELAARKAKEDAARKAKEAAARKAKAEAAARKAKGEAARKAKAEAARKASAKAAARKAKEDAERARTFTVVEADAWIPRLGPKMWSGSNMAHSVFEGPFGPSPRSLFSIVRRKNDTFFVLVMGDDGKGWPAGPLAETAYTPDAVTAVSFFDANKDGSVDALVMATYFSMGGGAVPFNSNVLLTWTSRGMRRLLRLEPKIAQLKSVAAVKRALGV